jgi:glutamate dehydrogenase
VSATSDAGDEHLVSAAAGDDGSLALLRAYYRHVAPEDLADRTREEVLAAALSHRETARRRAPGTANVAVRVLPARTVVEVVTDDMPFLVDSLTAEITRQGRPIRLVVHPQLAVRRDATGELEQVGEPHDGAPSESWIAVEVDPDDEGLDALATALRRVLADVRAAVEDWSAMCAATGAAIEGLATAPAGSPQVDDTRELLRWLADDHFAFLGSADYVLEDGRAVLVPGSGLGLLREERTAHSTQRLAEDVHGRPPMQWVLVLTKTSTRSTVHRPAYLDVVSVQRFDTDGRVVGERRFLGLLASAAYTESVTRIPLVKRRVAQVLALSGYPPASHSGKDLIAILETFPRDELFQTGTQQLLHIVTNVLRLRERRQTRLFLRRDEYGRYLSVLVYLPRDRYTTTVRLAMEQVLREAFDAQSIDFTARVTESVLARLHFVVRAEVLPDVDSRALEARLAAAARSWDDDLAEAVQARLGRPGSVRLLKVFGDAFPEAYKEDFPAATAVDDVLRLAALEPDGPLAMTMYAGAGEPPDRRRLKLFRDGPLSLAEVLPVLQGLGVDVLDERPYELHCTDGRLRWVYDFGLRYRVGSGEVPAGADPLFLDAFAAVWSGRAENDGFHALVTRGRLSWRQVVVLRAYAKYLRQAASTFSQEYVQEVLVGNVGIAVLLVRLFESLFDPAGGTTGPSELTEQITTALDDVASLDQDRILRSLLALVHATVRTNHYQSAADGGPKPYLSLKLDPQRVPDLPQPRPAHEIWVYSPRFEGVHLRFGAVARGGLRWSDRREDFRTEVLGLVKAQTVKNAVIVPTGAKGGFVGKRLPDPAVDREAWLAEGIACYRGFIGGLLDLTDNLVDGEVVPPRDTVRLDGDDTYLVVAADKGTATFSDIANAVAAEYGFWLGDAFASGGSAGYDHKAMGITARGAWESVRRHFRELGVDVQREPVTVVGVGDMSGDVFGNGMLLSPHLRLVAAFDHRHVFLDPSPDPATSYDERARLFALPRSSWADYDPALLSEGGGVFARTAKRIPVTPQVREVLGLPDGVEAIAPQELMRAVLTAPVDLFWNGGIGTYVKASTETSLQVGDKANDTIRVNGSELRARVVGEGGNLGLTQLGRIEYALSGGRLNTDAIDNSAGVDTSDHEVNFKVLLDRAVRDGDLTTAGRDELLASMTDAVAALVLSHNYGQNATLATARHQAPSMLPVHARFLAQLEKRGQLDRELEFLPQPKVLEQRAAAGRGLTSSELSVLLAYSKTTLTAQVLDSTLPEDPWFQRSLRGYFPPALVSRYDSRLDTHPLRRQIITTSIVNDLVDHGGITFVFRACEETGATPPEVVRAYTVAREVFGFEDLWREAASLDDVVPTAAQTTVYLEGRRLLDRTTRWLLQARRSSIDVAAEVERFRAPLAALAPRIPALLVGVEAERLERRAGELAAAGLPANLALRTASLLDAFSLLDVVTVAAGTGQDVDEVAPLYFLMSDRYQVDVMLSKITALPRSDRWQALARSSLRYDLYAALAGLTSDILRSTPPGTPADRVAQWEQANDEGLTRARSTLTEVLAAETADLATLSVALRTVRTLLPG